ncbi:hypothetical protein COU17_02555 [Candidatus Kaiserbacteria bacterium CG10_big_fil_rev_8_21_14_0_10_49_17]|uniref:Type 4a pilus biogenesis protein PilO n=1 Tax=Candidatus Kaiserbacteria bacterium CG10_big_fil_rev_8_21_14_0_10_49_17 TaxID=1974609 RepID=A0A2M6WE02_9BACT|nr:MAG: hypothetical protein COU17_02555 [Candidatus Kaiserbacteria bacterium CG10_big_fil_rev_8_21_14_0_10_49_17]
MIKVLTPILLVIATVGIFLGYINPAYAEIQALRADEEQFNQALERARELQSVRDALLSRYNTFAKDDIDRLEKLLPDHIDNVRLILDIDGIASKYNMRTRNVTISQGNNSRSSSQNETAVVSVDTNPYGSVVIEFSVAATYEDFLRFLHDLESSLRVVDLVGLSFQSDVSGDLYEFAVSLKTYWLK